MLQMKKTYSFLVLLLFVTSGILSQNVQRGFNFQSVARDQSGAALASVTVELRVSIYPEGDQASPVYTETHSLPTNIYGIYQLTIGSVSPGSFGDINFAETNYWLLVESRIGTDPFYITSNMELPATAYAKLADVAGNSVPPGSVMPFAGEKANIPSGWLYCDGSSYATTGEYAKLYAAIGYSCGNDGGLFRVPDLRGIFMRGADDGLGADPDADARLAQNAGGNTGDMVGTMQQATINGHLHGVNIPSTTSADGAHQHEHRNSAGQESTGRYFAYGAGATVQTPNHVNSNTTADGVHSHTFDVNGNTEEVGGNEIRPINAGVFYLIKL